MISIIALDSKEEFLQFLDENLLEIKETIETGGLRTINVTYTFQDLQKDKELFRLGNKLWIQGDTNLSDCLYVINTKVTQNVYDENTISFEAEEVLVELNYAPLFTQTELDVEIDGVKIFKAGTGDGEVIIDWNSLNYWFGDYYNIATVQDCISPYAQKVTITGTLTRMALLRQIEEETGNIFVTRYEKNPLNNTIHRYLDFLNPINVNKPWTLHTEYTFIDTRVTAECYDENGDITTEDKPWEASPFWNPNFEPIPETVDTDIPTETETEGTYEYHADSETLDKNKDYTPLTDLNPTYTVFRIVSDDNIQLTADDGTDLSWTASDIGFTTETENVVIQLIKTNTEIELLINEKSFLITSTLTDAEPVSTGFIMGTPTHDNNNKREIQNLPDNSYFEIYDEENEIVIHRVMINNTIGTVHDEILDFGYNLENIIFDIDETDTYSAVSPVLKISEGDNGLSRTQLGSLINAWRNLQINKGDTIPMIVEHINKKASTLSAAKTAMGTKTLSTNYWVRPYNPQDNKDASSSSDYTWDFLKATSYWKAPYKKNSGELWVSTDNNVETEYLDIYTRNDTRIERGAVKTPKMGTTESTDEDVYQIYNQVALYLKEHETPSIDIQVDVANLRRGQYNDYDIWDKVYIKLPDSQELVTARVTKTEKEAHDVAKNTITLNNYTTKYNLKTPVKETFLTANNLKFKYPNTKTLVVTLTNHDYDELDPDSIEHPAIKLISFTVYKIENGSRTWTGKIYTRTTNADGQAKVLLSLDPAEYEIDIHFNGDEEYDASQLTVNILVSGTKEVPAQMTTSSTNAKTTAKTSTKTKTVKTYWTKCGLSPDKKHKEIVSVAKPSASNSDMRKYGVKSTQLYNTVFKNKCPECGRQGTLRFDGGKKNKCITSSTYGHPWKNGVPEHEITCIHCDSDFDGVTGLEKNYGHSTRLKMVKKPVKATNSDFAKLVKGQLVYEVKKVTQTDKANTDTRSTRKYRSSSLSKTIKNLAKSIVGDSIGLTAAKKIANWCDHNIAYHGYNNFLRSPDTVYKKKGGNCCDVTRFFFALCDAAGCCEYLDLYYIHVQCPKYGHVYGKVVTKKSKKWRFVDNASDYHVAWGYVIQSCPKKQTPASKYPKLPF